MALLGNRNVRAGVCLNFGGRDDADGIHVEQVGAMRPKERGIVCRFLFKLRNGTMLFQYIAVAQVIEKRSPDYFDINDVADINLRKPAFGLNDQILLFFASDFIRHTLEKRKKHVSLKRLKQIMKGLYGI